MKKILSMLVLAVALSVSAFSQVSIGIGQPYYPQTPACSFGYYDYYPYSCAPYGYYGPQWFNNGLFIGFGNLYSNHYYYGNRFAERSYRYRNYNYHVDRGGDRGFRGGYEGHGGHSGHR